MSATAERIAPETYDRPNRCDRWENWNSLSDFEDVWSTVDDLDDRRRLELKVRKQQEELDKKHERRVSKLQVDMQKFLEEEPFADMCNTPKHRPTGRSKEALQHAAEDKKILAAHRLEVERIMREKPRSQSQIAQEFGVSLSVLRKVLKNWGIITP